MKKVKVNRVNKNTNLIENFYNEHSGKGIAIDMETENITTNYNADEVKEKLEYCISKLYKSEEVFESFIERLGKAIENNSLKNFFRNQMKNINKLFSQPLTMENEDKINIIRILINILAKSIFKDIDDELFTLLKKCVIKEINSQEFENNELCAKEKLIIMISNVDTKKEFIDSFIEMVIEIEKEKLLEVIGNNKFKAIIKFINSELFPVSASGKLRELILKYPNYESTINWLIEKMDNIKIMIKSDIEFILDPYLPKHVIENTPFDYIGDGVISHYESNYLLILLKEKCVNIEEDEKVKNFFDQFHCTKEEEKDENK